MDADPDCITNAPKGVNSLLGNRLKLHLIWMMEEGISTSVRLPFSTMHCSTDCNFIMLQAVTQMDCRRILVGVGLLSKAPNLWLLLPSESMQ